MVRTLVAAVLVVVGFLGLLNERNQHVTAETFEAAGDFWRVTNLDGRILQLAPDPAGLRLRPGIAFDVLGHEQPGFRVPRLEFVLEKEGTQSSAVELRFRDVGASYYRLRVIPAAATSAELWYVEGANAPERLAVAVRRDKTVEGPFRVRLDLDGARFTASIDGETILEATDERRADGTASLSMDGGRLLTARIDQRVGGTPPHHADAADRVTGVDFRTWHASEDAKAGELRRLLIAAALVLLAAFGFLRALCFGRPRLRDLLRATLFALVPPAVVAGALAWLRAPYPPFAWPAICAAGFAGVLVGAFVLRAHLEPGAEAPRGARRLGIARAAFVTLILAALTAATVAHETWLATRDGLERADAAAKRAATEPFRQAGEVVLDASNAVTAKGPYRSFDLDARVTLDEGALFQVRFHGHPIAVQGKTLVLSADPRFESGFLVEDRKRFGYVGEGGGTVAAGTPLDVRLSVRGSCFEALVGGERVAKGCELDYPAGNVVVLAPAGRVRVADLSIMPAVPEPPVADAPVARHVAGLAAPALLVALALACGLLFRRGLRFVEPFAFAALPVVVALCMFGDGAPLLTSTFAWTAFATAAVLLAGVMFHGRGTAGWRVAVAALLLTAAAPFVVFAAAGEPVRDREALDPEMDEFPGERLAEGLVHFQHPKVRQFNAYLRDHTFRGRTFPVAKPQGTVRIVSLGTSSTWGAGTEEGSGLDYPAQAEALLRERFGDRVEVINAAIRGSGGAFLLHFFSEVLLRFDPDVVTISLSYNDSGHLAQLDEAGFLARRMQPDYTRSIAQRISDRVEVARGVRAYEAFDARLKFEKGDVLGTWVAAAGEPGGTTPPERFEAILRDFHRVCSERGIRLVLIQEPPRPGAPWLWKDLFHGVIAKLGAELDVPVVDPTPAILAAGGAKLFMDQIHPLPTGYRVVAEVLAPVLEKEVEKVLDGL